MKPLDVQDPARAEAARARELEAPAVRVVRPVKRRVRLRDLVLDAAVIRVLSARDFKVKYKQSVLGPLWLVFQPLALLAAFIITFRGLADVQSGVTYVVFALVGLSVWAFFQASMTIGTASMISNVTLVRFTPCPRLAFPVASIIASLPSYAVTIVAAIASAAVTGSLSPRALLLPLGLVWLFILTLGVVAFASALTVRYRDLLAAMPFLLQVGLFLAPVGYPLSELGPTVRAVLDLNPLTGLMEACRWMLISGYTPSFEPIGASLVLTPLVFLAGWLTFSRLEPTMADEI